MQLVDVSYLKQIVDFEYGQNMNSQSILDLPHWTYEHNILYLIIIL